MAVKNVSPPFQFFSSLAVTGTSVVSNSSASSVLYKDNIGLQYAFTGNMTGQIDVQVSNDYNPGMPESAGTANAGSWTSVVQTSPNTLPYILGSGTANVFINLSGLGCAWLRTQYTNSSGTGTMTGTFVAKSLG